MVVTMPQAEELEDFVWQDYALCKDVAEIYPADENPFFKEGRGKTYPLARSYCANCSVVIDCLIDGIDDEEGFRGATSPTERKEIRKMLRQGVRFRDAVEKLWDSHRASRRGGEVPRSIVWEEWV